MNSGGAHGSHHIISVSVTLPDDGVKLVQIAINDTLDGVVINVTYTPPGFTVENGCIVAHPYPGDETCALVTTSGSQAGLALQGTLYAPAAAVDRSHMAAARVSRKTLPNTRRCWPGLKPARRTVGRTRRS